MPIRRGEIYLVNLNPVQGREQPGFLPLFSEHLEFDKYGFYANLYRLWYVTVGRIAPEGKEIKS
jgi:hypothetical protein